MRRSTKRKRAKRAMKTRRQNKAEYSNPNSTTQVRLRDEQEEKKANEQFEQYQQQQL